MISQRAQLESQIAQARRILERNRQAGPFGDCGMAAHVAELEGRLAELKGELSAGCARVELKFDGPPVLGQSGIRADFAASALGSFMQLFKRLARIKNLDDGSLFFTAPARGSFGFVLQEMGQEQLVDQSKLAATSDELNSILKQISSQEEESDGLDIDPTLMRPLQDFLNILSKNSATVLIDAGATNVELGESALKTASSRIERVKIDSSESTYVGVLHGVLPFNRTFEFTPDGEGAELIRGEVDSSLDINDEVKPLDMERCSVTIEENVAEYPSGRSRRWYVLKEIEKE